jgi:subtilisin family serine protease
VAVIDSGIDAGHPEFAGKIAAARSFVGAPSDVTDREGHGTFVAGEIAAIANNGVGIAGIAFPAQLVVAKVVGSDGTIAPEVEAKAIRWAVAQGARVINLSLGGLRDPLDPRRDTYSSLEARAVEYATSRGVVVVAAVGNGDEAPRTPWLYASYPAALPHVLGVSALGQDGSIPLFSNRDAIYNDLAAPGAAILSTFPRALTATRPSCPDQGYSDCGSQDYREAEGTSFAAPQVAAAAALVLSVAPQLTADQVTALIEHSAVDMTASTGCPRCLPWRDPLSGWGRLDVAAALQALNSPLPVPDRYEANDDAGAAAWTLYGDSRQISATLDYWDDQIDVYRIWVRAGERITATLHGPASTDTNLVLWKPGTKRVEGLSLKLQSQRATQSAGQGPNEHLGYRAGAAGWYYLEVKLSTPAFGAYTLRYTKSG